MEYAGALGTIIFDESCYLCDLTEAQVGQNQFAMNVAVDQLDDKIDEVDGSVRTWYFLKVLFQPIPLSFYKQLPLLHQQLLNDFTTLTTYDSFPTSQTRTGLSFGMLTSCRTKHGLIK